MSGQFYRKFYSKKVEGQQAEQAPLPQPQPTYRRKTTYRVVTLWQKAESDMAILFSKGSKATDSDQFWLPKSQIRSIHRSPARDDDWPECRVEVAEWLLNKNNL